MQNPLWLCIPTRDFFLRTQTIHVALMGNAFATIRDEEPTDNIVYARPYALPDRVNVILLGDSGIGGKTCLLHRLCEDKYANDFITTIGNPIQC